METPNTVEQAARDEFTVVATGDAALAAACIHPEHVNDEAVAEPPACALPGVPGILATSAWLRLAFTDLAFQLDDVVVEGGRVLCSCRMSGRQTGPFVIFPPGEKPVAFPPTGRSFSVRQMHLIDVRDGLAVRHAAVRDDLGMMTQLGHLPPTPAVGLRMARWNLGGGAKRAVARAVDVAAAAAEAVAVTSRV